MTARLLGAANPSRVELPASANQAHVGPVSGQEIENVGRRRARVRRNEMNRENDRSPDALTVFGSVTRQRVVAGPRPFYLGLPPPTPPHPFASKKQPSYHSEKTQHLPQTDVPQLTQARSHATSSLG